MGYKEKRQEPAVKRGMENQTFKSQEADVSSKRIFGNHTLCAQFSLHRR